MEYLLPILIPIGGMILAILILSIIIKFSKKKKEGIIPVDEVPTYHRNTPVAIFNNEGEVKTLLPPENQLPDVGFEHCEGQEAYIDWNDLRPQTKKDDGIKYSSPTEVNKTLTEIANEVKSGNVSQDSWYIGETNRFYGHELQTKRENPVPYLLPILESLREHKRLQIRKKLRESVNESDLDFFNKIDLSKPKTKQDDKQNNKTVQETNNSQTQFPTNES